MSRGLILGGARFHGFLLAEYLSKNGDEIHVLNRGNYRTNYDGRIKRLFADRNDPKQLEKTLGDLKFDYTIDNNGYNAEQIDSLLTLFGERLGHYLFTSSAAVYLNPFSSVRLGEEDADGKSRGLYAPDVEEYALNKFHAERRIEKFKDVKNTIIRLPNIFGEGDFLGKLSFFKEKMKDGDKILLEEEVQSTSMVYSLDLPRTYDSIINNGDCFNKIINVADAETYTYETFLSAVFPGFDCGRIMRVPSKKMLELGHKFLFGWAPPLDVSLAQSLIVPNHTPLEVWSQRALEWEIKNLDEKRRQEHKLTREKELEIIRRLKCKT